MRASNVRFKMKARAARDAKRRNRSIAFAKRMAANPRPFLSQLEIEQLLHERMTTRAQIKYRRMTEGLRRCKKRRPSHWLAWIAFPSDDKWQEFPTKAVLLNEWFFVWTPEPGFVQTVLATTEKCRADRWFDNLVLDGLKGWEYISRNGFEGARRVAALMREAFGPLPVRIYGRESIRHNRKDRRKDYLEF